MEKWEDSLYRFFYRSLSHHADSQDLTQKTFLRVYKAAASYVPKAKFSTWLFTIARNLLIDEIKKRNRFKTSEVMEETHPVEDFGDEARIRDWREILEHSIRGIPENQRTALLLQG